MLKGTCCTTQPNDIVADFFREVAQLQLLAKKQVDNIGFEIDKNGLTLQRIGLMELQPKGNTHCFRRRIMKYKMNNIYNEDCLEAMKQIPDKYFDLAIVDPPYGIGADSRSMSNRASNSRKFLNYKGKQFIGQWIDDKPAPKEYFKELFRVSKNQIIWGANHFIEQFNKNSSCWLVWYKNGQN